ncbi:MAG: HI0074 family nucleotidyltransferase substrate-binding subunit [Dysgonamonadaceae bacterium]|nr:HI0074 family nucleotidyltransferase substrate-binding subunit [Dysgonamonadaceae bacterium]MDD4728110.1 HI0074 family nucleotidyltransferase substrate-binding subunit [Dysgonamonadaceae bacterium]
MNMEQDVKWKPRFYNFLKALNKLTEAVDYIKHNMGGENQSVDKSEKGFVLDEVIKDGLVQRFEYTHELAWTVMKDYAEYQGSTNISNSSEVTREAFLLRLFSNGPLWLEMIESRSNTLNAFDEGVADDIFLKIMNKYYPAFLEFKKIMESKRAGGQIDLL